MISDGGNADIDGTLVSAAIVHSGKVTQYHDRGQKIDSHSPLSLLIKLAFLPLHCSPEYCSSQNSGVCICKYVCVFVCMCLPQVMSDYFGTNSGKLLNTGISGLSVNLF